MKPPADTNNLFHRATVIIEQARSNVVRSVNIQMVIAYWPAPVVENSHAARDPFDPNLSWTHYRMLLKTENDQARSFYVLDEENQQIFASRYKLELPNEEELATELRREVKRLAAAKDSGRFRVKS